MLVRVKQNTGDFTNYISLLNNYCQEQKLLSPIYTLVEQSGKSHLPVFKISCSVNGITTFGVAKTKQEAKRLAAKEAVNIFDIKIRNFGESFKLLNAFPEKVWEQIYKGEITEVFFTIRRRINDNIEEHRVFRAIFNQHSNE